ncbi:MAG: radical SAM family heme chaperone HemW [Anaerolineae bacterium]|jgi:oxygen-independent coproporphyrinogen-3 oxidase|nr:radical SAM family heme chaperone HemW [Anaerolineae bacterium]
MGQSTLSLYLHIPFCKTMCTYCAFNTYTGMEDSIAPFVQALKTEIRTLADSQPGLPVGTIFFGGGTPSLLTPEQFATLLLTIQQGFTVAADAEISLEANPNDLTQPYLAALRQTGLNRLSIGMQSASAAELHLFNRRHDVPMVVAAMQAARAAGFASVNLDLIYGTPGQSLADWEATLQQALALQPEHISLYGLELKGGTPMTRDVQAGRLPAPDDDLAADMYDLATTRLAAGGLQQYEISNWCRPGYEARHNLQYWRNLPYAGLGPGAHGYAGGIRYTVIRLPGRYMAALEAAPAQRYPFPRTPATAKAVRVSRKTEISETIMMGLRLTREGIQRATFQERFGVDLAALHGPTLERFVRHGLLEMDDHVIRLTQAGRLVSNMVIRELI